jgi:hypothetical protein
MQVPSDKKLYNQVKDEAKKRFLAWPSAYASGWLVREYKRRGGKYEKNNNNNNKSKSKGLPRWFSEKWIDVCKLPKKIPCGRSKANVKKYPYCRPSIRITSRTPRTVKELSKNELEMRCKRKRQSPNKRLVFNMTKYEKCVLAIKKREKSTCFKKGKFIAKKGCYNPWAVCTKSVGRK